MGTRSPLRNFFLVCTLLIAGFLGCQHGKNYTPAAPGGIDETPSLGKSTTPVAHSRAIDILVNTTSDAADFGGAQQISDLPGPDGVTSLREGITAANNTPGPQVIGFHIPISDAGFDGKVFTIQPPSGLPSLSTGGTTIDGATQTDFTGDTNSSGPEVVLSGALMSGAGADGITISSADNAIHSLVINAIPGPCCPSGISIVGSAATGNVVTGCYIGLDATGTAIIANENNGISIHQGASGNRIGGPTASERNVISGNTFSGITITAGSGNIVQGNLIGTDASGVIGLGNGCEGIIINGGAHDNLIGGNSAGARNLLASNGCSGIFIGSGGASRNTVLGNFIGTDITGKKALPNGEDGTRIVSEPGFRADGNHILGNLISANAIHGVGLFATNENELRGNLIGTNAAAEPVLGNHGYGVRIGSGPAETPSNGNRIGGDEGAEGNVIAGNGLGGVLIGDGGNADKKIWSNGTRFFRITAMESRFQFMPSRTLCSETRTSRTLVWRLIWAATA